VPTCAEKSSPYDLKDKNNQLYLTKNNKIMKKYILILISLFFTVIIYPQNPVFDNTISINQTFTTHSEIYPFSGDQMYGIGVNGTITFTSDTSIFKIIIKDAQGLEYLIYESNTMLDDATSFSFNEECEETCFFDGFTPTVLEFQIVSANVYLNEIKWSGTLMSDPLMLQQQARDSKMQEKINTMNTFIQNESLIWIAGETDFTGLYYKDKKDLYKSTIWNPAIEFYVSGVFSLKSPENGVVSVNYDFVDNFEWRNRHGANDPNSNYFDGSDDGSGWTTKAACQDGCWINGILDCSIPEWSCNGIWNSAATCWAFGPTSHIEALVNLYLNDHMDVDLAEQEIVSCSYGYPRPWEGWPSYSYNYFRDVGVVNEDCFPYTTFADPCNTVCSDPIEQISIGDWYQINSPTETQLRQIVMNDGPVSAAYMDCMWGIWSHSMQLVGWDVIEWGDEDILGVPLDPPVFSLYVGCTYWIYKQNSGNRNDMNGFFYMIHEDDAPPKFIFNVPTDVPNFVSSNLNTFNESDIQCLDNDNDGYFNWGIGPKPAQCPPCPDEPDGDDNNSGLGPFDEYGFCRIIDTYNSDFETTMNYWKQSENDDCDWIKYYGPTANRPETGPNGTPNGSIYYIYMKADQCYTNTGHLSVGAYIESPPIDLADACAIEVTFAYHKNNFPWGNDDTDDSKLSVDISYDGGQTWVEDYWYVIGDQNDQWHYVTINLPSDVNKLRFYAFTGWINWFNDIALDDITIGPATNEDIVITGTKIWNYPNFHVCQNIIIEPNSSLTLTNGCTLHMNEGTNIIVKQYGNLIIDNGGITSSENDMWDGIQVWGNTNAHQFTINDECAQGKLIMNGATIENAYNAVTLWKPDDWNTRGGIIQAENSRFINNRRSIEFMSYQNFHPYSGDPMYNLSYFTECEFDVNDDYIVSSDFAYHISMWEVKGINISACEFSNSMTNTGNTGYGIYTMDAGYCVRSSCTTNVSPCPEPDILHSTFTGLYAGIGALNSGSSYTFYVNDAVFDNNGYGIKLNASNYATLINNDFYVGDNTIDAVDCAFNFGVGVDLTNCNGYAVEENKFYESTTMTGNSIGVRVNYEEEYINNVLEVQNNEIYKNQYDGLYVGNEALGYNFNNNSQDGLQFLCNINQNNTYDFYIKDDGIKLYQGTLDEAAGNEFSLNANNPFSDYNNQAVWSITYFYNENNPDEIPVNYSEKVFPNVAQNNNECISHFGGGNSFQTDGLGLTDTQKITYEQQYSDNLSSYNGTLALYEALKDGGNTETVVIDIETAWPDEMWELRADLLAKSPHLSMEVLKTTADNTDIFPDAVIFEILSANPDEMKDEAFLTYLAEKENPLPEYMIDILRGLAGNISYKTILQSQMSGYKSKMTEAAYIIIRNMLNDSICDMESVRYWLENLNSLASDYQIIDSYLQEGNTSDALTLLGLIPSAYDLVGEDIIEYNRYSGLKQLQATLINQGRNIFMLSDTEKSILEEIADNSNGQAGTQARNILEFVYGNHYCDCPQIPDSVTYKNYKPSFYQQTKALYKAELDVFPNPAKTWTAFEYHLPYNNGDVYILIYNAQGQIVHTLHLSGLEGQDVWDVRDVKPGVYHYVLKSAGGTKSGNLIISN